MTVKAQKILVVKTKTAQAGWNQHLLTPLVDREKVIVSSDQSKVEKGYIRVKHGHGEKKAISVFSVHHFMTLNGKDFAKLAGE